MRSGRALVTGFVGALVLAALLRSPEPANDRTDDELLGDAHPRGAIEGTLPTAAPPQQSTPTTLQASSAPPLPVRDGLASAAAPPVSLPQVAQDIQLASPAFAGQIAEAEREMASQDKDPLRSPAMEARILGEIAQKALGLGMTDLQADCRITLCRVQFGLPKSFLERKFGNVPRDAVWTGHEPVGFFIKALDLEWRYTTAFGGLDRYGTPVVLGYVSMPSPTTAQP